MHCCCCVDQSCGAAALLAQASLDAALLPRPCSRPTADTIQQLGQFYQANGARARLSEELGSSLLDQLHRAEGALPALPEQKLFPF